MIYETDDLRNIQLEPVYLGRSLGREKRAKKEFKSNRNDIDKNLIPDLIKPERKMCLRQLTHNLSPDYLNAGKYN